MKRSAPETGPESVIVNDPAKHPERAPKPVKEPKMYGPYTAVGLTLFIFFASQVVAGVLILIYPLLRHWSEVKMRAWLSNSVNAQFFLVVLIEALTIGSVLLLLKWWRLPKKVIGLVEFKARDVLYALIGFAVYFPVFLTSLAAFHALVPSVNLEQRQQLGFDTATGPNSLILVFISLVILPPLAEEILVRGFLYTGLRGKLKFLPALLITSAIFAAAHLQIGSGAPLLWTAALDTFILSVVLVYLREKTKSLWPGIILHALKNGLAFVVLFSAR